MENTRVAESKSTRKSSASTTKKVPALKTSTRDKKPVSAKNPSVKSAAEKPAKKKSSAATSAKPTAPKTPKAKPTEPMAKASPTPFIFKPDRFQDLIEQTAYYMAECRGFQGGDASRDWASSETLVANIFHRILAYLPNER